METTAESYRQQAKDLLEATGTEFKVEFKKHGKHFDDDKDTRDIYTVTLTRGGRKFTFEFGQSLNNSQQYKPLTAYAKSIMADLLMLWDDEENKTNNN